MHRVTSRVPFGHRVNLVFQKYVTHTYPRSDLRLVEVVERGRRHARALSDAGIDLPSATLFEFGAGWDLAVPLTLATLGVRRQVVVDLNPLLRSELVVDTAARLVDGFKRFGLPPHDGARSGPDVLGSRGIEYRAPCDARRTGLPSASIDAITSTSTLEHVPADDIKAILEEGARILRPGGLLSFEIDYTDHYSHGDRSISPYNFLQFSDRQWRRYNSALHYQNRLRHSDYLEIFEGAGLELLTAEVRRPDERRRAQLSTLAIDSHFESYLLDDLEILEGWFVLRCP